MNYFNVDSDSCDCVPGFAILRYMERSRHVCIPECKHAQRENPNPDLHFKVFFSTFIRGCRWAETCRTHVREADTMTPPNALVIDSAFQKQSTCILRRCTDLRLVQRRDRFPDDSNHVHTTIHFRTWLKKTGTKNNYSPTNNYYSNNSKNVKNCNRDN
eukprot:6470745-Amphidinium_carterae.1